MPNESSESLVKISRNQSDSLRFSKMFKDVIKHSEPSKELIKELSKEYYIKHLIYNLEKLELIETSDQNPIKNQIVNTVNYIYKRKRDVFENKQRLKLLVKEILVYFCSTTTHDLDNFNKLYLADNKAEVFSTFIGETFTRFQQAQKSKEHATDLAGWVEYSFRLNEFLKKDNLIIAALISTYILMQHNLQLPQVLSKENLIANFSDSPEDGLAKWAKFYYSQFGAWEIGKKETFIQSLNSKETMLRSITRSIDDIRDMQNITGETSLDQLVVHTIDRTVLHALIIKFISEYQIKEEDQLNQYVNDYYSAYLQNKESKIERHHLSASEWMTQYIIDDGVQLVEKYKLLPEREVTRLTSKPIIEQRDILLKTVQEKETYYSQLFEAVEKNKFFLGDDKFKKEDVIACQNIMAQKEKIINQHAALLPKTSLFKEDSEKKYKVYKQSVIDAMLRDLIEQKAEAFVNGFIDKSLPKLENRENLGRVSWIVAGGPASGKTSIVELAEKDLGKDKVNTAILNPDYYKKILLDPKEVDDPIKHAELTHVESSFVNKKIMGKMKNFIKSGRAPDILFDAVKASQDKIGVTKEGNATVNIYMATCSPEEAIRRAFDRGRRHGRFVPTEIVLEGHKESTRLLPEVLAKNNVVFRLFFTEVSQKASAIEIASIYDRSTILDIHEAKLMFDFVLKSKINPKAKSPDEVYMDEVYENKVKQIAICIAEYIKQGLTLRFGYYSENKRYKTCAILSPKEGLLITNIDRFVNSIATGNPAEKNKYASNLIFRLSQCEISKKKLAVSIHSGKTSRKDLHIENGKCLYRTKEKSDFSELYEKLIKNLSAYENKIDRNRIFSSAPEATSIAPGGNAAYVTNDYDYASVMNYN